MLRQMIAGVKRSASAETPARDPSTTGTTAMTPSKRKGAVSRPSLSTFAEVQPYIAGSSRSPAMRCIAFCSFSKARTSIWRMRSRLTS